MAGVIRAGKLASAKAFSFSDLETQAREISDRARAAAKEIIRDAERQARASAETILRLAREEGFVEGRRAGFEQAQRDAADAALKQAQGELDKLASALRTALSGFDVQKRSLVTTAETGLIKLALAIARRVCKHEVGRDSRTAFENVRHLLELTRHDEDLTVKVHPAELEQVQNSVNELLADAERLGHVAIVPDEHISRGGCTLTSSGSAIDARIETQLDRIAEALMPEARDPGDDA